jgi:hypothetical protein
LFETDLEQEEHTSSFLYLSIPRFAIREYRLKKKVRDWTAITGTVESAHRSVGGYRETIRGELWYSYAFAGEQYSGHVIRDSGCSGSAATRLAEFERGQAIVVFVNPGNPKESYFPSGFGFAEPILVGALVAFQFS